MIWSRWHLKSKNWERRLLAVRKLGTQKPPARPAVFLPILLDPADSVRRAALTALDRNHPDWRHTEAARAAVNGWFTNLAKGRTSEARERAAVALGLVRLPESLPSLIAALDDERSNVRRAAVESLGLIGDRRAVEPVRAATQDEQIGTVAREMLKILEKLPSGDVAPSEMKPASTRDLFQEPV